MEKNESLKWKNLSVVNTIMWINMINKIEKMIQKLYNKHCRQWGKIDQVESIFGKWELLALYIL